MKESRANPSFRLARIAFRRGRRRSGSCSSRPCCFRVLACWSIWLGWWWVICVSRLPRGLLVRLLTGCKAGWVSSSSWHPQEGAAVRRGEAESDGAVTALRPRRPEEVWPVLGCCLRQAARPRLVSRWGSIWGRSETWTLREGVGRFQCLLAQMMRSRCIQDRRWVIPHGPRAPGRGMVDDKRANIGNGMTL